MADENNTPIETWQQQLLYIQKLNEQYCKIEEYLDHKDLIAALSKEELLLATLEPVLQTRKRKDQEYSTDYVITRKDIQDASTRLLMIPKRTQRDNEYAVRKQMQEVYDAALRIYVKLGNLMMDNDLIFKKGINSSELWLHG